MTERFVPWQLAEECSIQEFAQIVDASPSEIRTYIDKGFLPRPYHNGFGEVLGTKKALEMWDLWIIDKRKSQRGPTKQLLDAQQKLSELHEIASRTRRDGDIARYQEQKRKVITLQNELAMTD